VAKPFYLAGSTEQVLGAWASNLGIGGDHFDDATAGAHGPWTFDDLDQFHFVVKDVGAQSATGSVVERVNAFSSTLNPLEMPKTASDGILAAELAHTLAEASASSPLDPSSPPGGWLIENGVAHFVEDIIAYRANARPDHFVTALGTIVDA
jgi:hypothetical protein